MISRWAFSMLCLILVAVLSPTPTQNSLQDQLARAGTAASEGNYGNALAELNPILERFPHLQDLRVQAVDFALRAGDKAQAHYHYSFLDTVSRGSNPCLHGRILLAEGDFNTTKAWLEGNARVICPSFVTELETHISALRASAQWEPVIEAYQILITLHPDPELLYQVNLIKSALDPQSALEGFRTILLMDPNDYPLARDLARVILNTGGSSDQAYQLTQVGRQLIKHDQWDLALTAFQKAIRLRPDYPEAHALLGVTHQQQGQDGVDHLQRALSLKPDSAEIHVFLAQHLLSIGSNETALDHLQTASRLSPNNPAILAELGRAFALNGEVEAAKSAFVRSVEAAPGDPRFWLMLAQFSISHEIENKELAIPAARTALRLHSRSPQALDLLGYAHYLQGELNLAERFLHEAVRISPSFAQAHYHLGLLHMAKGDLTAAKEAFQQAIRLDESGRYAQLAQRSLEQGIP